MTYRTRLLSDQTRSDVTIMPSWSKLLLSTMCTGDVNKQSEIVAFEVVSWWLNELTCWTADYVGHHCKGVMEQLTTNFDGHG